MEGVWNSNNNEYKKKESLLYLHLTCHPQQLWSVNKLVTVSPTVLPVYQSQCDTIAQHCLIRTDMDFTGILWYGTHNIW